MIGRQSWDFPAFKPSNRIRWESLNPSAAKKNCMGSIGCLEGLPMADAPRPERESADQKMDEALRRALATPPISNEDILKRSKESQRK